MRKGVPWIQKRDRHGRFLFLPAQKVTIFCQSSKHASSTIPTLIGNYPCPRDIHPIWAEHGHQAISPPRYPGSVEKARAAIAKIQQARQAPHIPPFLNTHQVATVSDVTPLIVPEVQRLFRNILGDLSQHRIQEYAKAKFTLNLLVDTRNANKYLNAVAHLTDIQFKMMMARYVNDPALFMKIIGAKDSVSVLDVHFFMENFLFLKKQNPELYEKSLGALKSRVGQQS